jgi:hypothetical protein
MPKKKKPNKEKTPEDASPPTPTDTPTTDEPSAQVVDIAILPIWQVIPIFMGILDRIAWQRMGLVVNPQTQELEKDMEQARIAINLYEAMFKHLEPKLDEETQKQINSRLTDLKLNFASHS